MRFLICTPTTCLKIQGAFIPRRVFTQAGPIAALHARRGMSAIGQSRLQNMCLATYSAVGKPPQLGEDRDHDNEKGTRDHASPVGTAEARLPRFAPRTAGPFPVPRRAC